MERGCCCNKPPAYVCGECESRVYCSKACADYDWYEKKHWKRCRPSWYSLKNMREASPDVPMSPEADRLRRKFAKREAKEERQRAIDRGEVEVINDGEILSQKHTYVSPPRPMLLSSDDDDGENDRRIYFSDSSSSNSSQRVVYPNPGQMDEDDDPSPIRRPRRLYFDEAEEEEDEERLPKTQLVD